MRSLNAIATLILMTSATTHAATEGIVDFGASAYSGYTQTAGWIFQPTTSISVTSLGCFDYLFPGQGPILVGLWASDGTLLASNTITSSSPLVNQSRYEMIAPVSLAANVTYYIGATSTNGSLEHILVEVPGGGGSVTTSSGIQLGTAAFSTNSSPSGLVFPSDLEGGPGAAALTGNFEYTVQSSTNASLSISANGNEYVVTWTNAAFSLQTASDLTGTFTNIPGATSPYTNLISGPERYFRLIGN